MTVSPKRAAKWGAWGLALVTAFVLFHKVPEAAPWPWFRALLWASILAGLAVAGVEKWPGRTREGRA